MQIEALENSGSVYYNYRGTFSIVLMAIVDANYCIRYADVGCQGRISDGGVFTNTTFYKKLIKNELKLPKSTCISETSQGRVTPFVLVADDAICTKLKPYKALPRSISKGFPRKSV